MRQTLHNLLHAVQRLDRRQRMLRTAAAGAAAFVGALLVAVVADAVLALPMTGLLILDALLLAVLVAVVVSLVRTWRQTKFEPRRIARLIEQRLEVQDSRFINAVALETSSSPADEPGRVSAELRELAVEAGEMSARDVAAAGTVDRRARRRALGGLATVAAVLLLSAMAAPRLYTMVVPRLLSPGADYPPFTLLDFDIATSPDRVHHGERATIDAAIEGPGRPGKATLVFTDTNPPRRVPMLRTAEGRFTLPIEQASESRRFYVETEGGRSYQHLLEVLPTPTFKNVSVTYDYPDYTGRPDERRLLDDRGVRAMQGSRVRIEVASNRPLDHARWRLDDGRTIEMSPDADDPTTAAGSFVLEESGSYRLSLVAADGHESADAMEGPIEAIEDAAPSVRLIDPDLRLIAPPGWSLPVRATARDDVSVERMVLNHTRNDEATERADLEPEARSAGAAEATRTLDFAELGAEVGDTIKGFVSAYDNHPRRPRSGDSEPFTVRVVSDEEYREAARQQYRAEQIAEETQRLRERMEELQEQREQLAEELEQFKQEIADQPDGPTEAQQQRLEQTKQKMEDYADQLDELAESMQQRAEQYDLYTFEEPYQQMLEQMADEMQQQADAARDRAQPLPGGQTPDIDAAIDTLREQQEQGEQQAEQVELTEKQIRQLIAAQALQAEAQRLIALADEQRDLADRLKPYAETERVAAAERSRAADLGEQQHELREELAALVGRLEKAADEAEHLLPTMAGSGREMAEQVRQMEIEQDQHDAAEGALAGLGTDAWTPADAAARKLESLKNQCEGMCSGNSLAEVDNPLSLSESQMGQCMSEIASANPSAGMGQGAGSAAGTSGVGGTAAGGEGQTGPGAAMDGFMPASPQAAVAAASDSPSTQPSPFDVDSDGFGLAGESAARAQERPGRAEVLDVDAPQTDRTAPPHAAGVPLQFKQMTQQYFRRLAEDSR